MAWFDDERFWSELREGIFDPQRLQAADAEVGALIELVELAPAAAVLDIPCGPGRHLVPLAARGYRVTGVDLSSDYLTRASDALRHAGATAELVRADMRAFTRPAAFDLALNLYTSFGYFGDAADDARFLGNLRTNLRAEGRLVLELLTRETVRGAAAEPAERTTSDGARLLESFRLVDSGMTLERTFTVERGDELHRFVATHRLYSVSELERLLAATGFARVRVFGDLTGRPFGPDAGHAVLVAVRS